MGIKLNIRQGISSSIIFSGLGIFSHYLLINSELFVGGKEVNITSPISYAYIIIAFNIVGFTIISLSHWTESIRFPNALRKARLPIVYLMAAIILLAVNYMIITIAKISVPAIFPNGGYRFLIAVWLIELVVMGLLLANRSAEKTMLLQREAARLQMENDNAKYETLQNQLNPHFLFNSLNTLIAEIEYNPQTAIRFTRELSDVYRYVLQGQQHKTMPLEEEMHFLNSYIYLHKVRIGDCIEVDNHISQPIGNVEIASLSLQIVAENVFKHNVINEEHKMVIRIEISDDGKDLVVSNSLQPKINSLKSGIGLKNLSSRYMLLCNRNVEYAIDKDQQSFIVKIPLIYDKV